LYGFATVSGFPNEFEVVDGLQKGCQPAAHDGVIVDHHDTNERISS
jgi:hypothetical protein